MTIVQNGDAENRVDITILGDGYTIGEMDKYATDVEYVLQEFFDQEPFREYQRYFNVHRVDVISNESGADHPERDLPVFVDTVFDATYNCVEGIQRLVCVDTTKVLSVVSNSVTPSQQDILLVLVNDAEYGGSGGFLGVASTHPHVVELTLHELGHSFGLLADEYFNGSSPPDCDASAEPVEPNVTKHTRRALIKWKHWIDADTPIPTVTTSPGVPGLYEGGKYCATGLSRPTYGSKMRTLFAPFEQINVEQLVKRVYNWVSPLDGSEPRSDRIRLSGGQTQLFRVSVPERLPLTLDVTWFIDGQLQGTGLGLLVSAATLVAGSHTVEVVVEDATPMVRSDPEQLLTERRSWVLTVSGGIGGALENPGAGSFKSGIGLISGWVCAANQVVVEVDGIPVEVAYGTSREDTRGICGDADNGFGALVNWNLFGDGEHTARALADGVEFASATFTVTTFGVVFLTGVSGEHSLVNFPQAGQVTLLAWEQASQNFVIVRDEGAIGGTRTGTGFLENPGAGSFKSGIGLISGWVCAANQVVVEVDGIPVEVAYGTSREDTRGICGDADNGFGALVNWNLFGDGEHTARALTDGVEFASATFTVTTFGVVFLTGVSGEWALADFPQAGTTTHIQWEQASQNFVIVAVE